MRKLFTTVALVAVVAAVGAVPAFSRHVAPRKAHAGTVVTVKGKEFRFTLSKTKVPAGKVTFVFTNVGKVPHDFKIAGKKTPIIAPKKTARLVVTLKKGKYPYLCTVPGHAAAGMKGTLTVA